MSVIMVICDIMLYILYDIKDMQLGDGDDIEVFTYPKILDCVK